MTDELFTRERLAGYNPHRLRTAVVLLVGAGALGNNVAQNLALSGVGELRIVDFDFIEPSNATRSPLFPRHAALGSKKKWKARELAQAAHRLSYGEAPIVRYATSRIESLGLGAFAGCDAVVSAGDSFRIRAWLADRTRLLGIPLVEGGFRGRRGNVSVYPNDSAESPCYRCVNPGAGDGGGVSCSLYARGVLADGGIPATQSIAALTGAYVAEAVIRSLHPEGSMLAHKLVTFDVASGRGGLVELATDPECQGVHRRIGHIRKVPVRAEHPARALLDTVPEFSEPELILPAEYLMEAPCRRCGKRLFLHKPEWAVTAAPECNTCDGEQLEANAAHVITTSSMRKGDHLAARKLRKLGIAPLDIVEVRDASTGESAWVQLEGSLDELFTTLRRTSTVSPELAPEFVPVAQSGEAQEVSPTADSAVST